MPPLDTGSVAHTLRLVDPLDRRVEPLPHDYPSVGAYLRAVREYRGWALAEIAEVTRVAKAYLTAIEEANAAGLPSRPFAVGYVRAYARALDLDEDAIAARFKAETPDTSAPLQAPIGVKHERAERRPLFVGLAGLVVLAVIGWNIAVRAVAVNEPPPTLPTVPPVAEAPLPSGPFALGAPVPVPAEQTTPVPYVTPGLAANPAPPPPATAPTQLIAPILDRSAPAIFTPKGAVHGVPAIGPTVVLQAKEPAALIVRGPTGAAHFARQLAAGESYRAPIGQKLTAEATDPAAFAVYINNQLQGALVAPQTPLDKAVADLLASQPPVPMMAPAQAAPAPSARPAAAARTPAAASPQTAPRPAAPAPAPAPAAAPSVEDAPLY